VVRAKRWVVRAGGEHTVRDVLIRAGADARAVAEGRVFLGRRRVRRDTEPVRPGDVVEVAPPLSRAGTPPLLILQQTEDLVAVEKPAGIPTIADHGGSAHALASLLAGTLGVDPASLHATSRLDREVSGVVVFALTRQARARLADARTRGAYERRYVAIATRAPQPPAGVWSEPIGRAADARHRMVGGRDPAPARTYYATCGSVPEGQALLAVAPATGRTHQIRVHAAHAAAALLGDRVYGGPARMVLGNGQVVEPRRIALHAYRVAVPSREGTLVAVSPVPKDLEDLWSALGGDARSWDVATRCAVPGS
jgi:23S rRNA pseudouridine1911/1915/1917 synthase